jgi:cytidylate kinase
MEQEKIATSGRAEVLLTELDRERDLFVKTFYDISWYDATAASAFDLVINTGKVPPDVAFTWIIQAVRGLEETKSKRDLTTASIEVDPTLARTVSEVLGCDVTHG